MSIQKYPGLTSAEVAARIKRGETNAFKARVGRSYWEIFRDNVLNLFNIVLLTLLGIVLLFRDYPTVIFAGISVVTNTLLGMIQEMDAKRKLDRLAALAARDVKVHRDGKVISVHSSQLVKDDVIIVEPGDRLVVDGRILFSDALEMDESHLTGESDAVIKAEGDPVYSGAFCLAGSGLMQATQVGKDSTINRLSTVAKVYKRVLTPSQEKLNAIVQITVLVMVIMVPMVFLAGFRDAESPLGILRNGVVFVSSLVPQGLVLAATLSLTLGALNISRHKTLIQRVNAVESMAYVTVLCLDKTGTITRNHLSVQQIIPLNGADEAQIRAMLATYTANLAHQNRTAAAIAEYVGANGTPVTKIKEIPFNSTRKWSAVQFSDHTLLLGAPERLIMAANEVMGGDAAQMGLLKRSQEFSEQGMRVVAFARTAQTPNGSNVQLDAEPLALVVLSDSVRDDIRETLQMFRDQGVLVKIVSGDNEATVRAIAAQAGLSLGKSYTGDEIDAMSDEELANAVNYAELFARISPETKRRIVSALRKQGHYAAMVGDGVNDVPALKEANLAIVMNDGAQISKDIADIVLLNNAISTLPLAFKEGKEITQTIFGTTKLFLVKNFYSLLLFTFVGVMSLPFPITPVQISWVTFGTVNIPATLVAFEILRPTYMRRFREDVLDFVLTLAVIGGVSVALVYALVFFIQNNDVFAARSAVTVYLALFGCLIFWLTHGLDLMQLHTFKGRWGIFWLGAGLTVMTMVVPYAFVDFFNGFTAPSLPSIILIVAVFLITVIVSSVGLRFRHLLNQFWMLTEPK